MNVYLSFTFLLNRKLLIPFRGVLNNQLGRFFMKKKNVRKYK